MAESTLKRSVFTDKHVVIALLVAPILAIASWYAVGWLAGDLAESEVAESGQAYPLLERSGCRYEGGECRVSNGDFILTLTVKEATLVQCRYFLLEFEFGRSL